MAVYFILFISPFPLNAIRYLSYISDIYIRAWNQLTLWTGRYILHLTDFKITLPNGSSDRLFCYVAVFVMLVLAIAIALVWQLFIRDEKITRTALRWVYVYVQFFFALAMMWYGLEKIVQAQFPFPYSSLTETYSGSSPAQLMWNFVGYSNIYNKILGITELVTGLLVFFKRTLMLGVLLGIIIMSNVVILNLCYDVPVKVFSINFLFMALFLALPYRKRLTRFFLTHETIPAAPESPLLVSRKASRLFNVVRLLVAVLVFYFNFQVMWHKYLHSGNGAFARTPLFGIYQVTSFIRNGDTLPPSFSDTSQWRALSIVYNKDAYIKFANDSVRNYRFVTDTVHHSIEIGRKTDTIRYIFYYEKPAPLQLLLKGRWQKDSLVIRLQKQNPKQYRLVNGGFHWIQEYPSR